MNTLEQYKEDNGPKAIRIAGEYHGVEKAQGWRQGFDAALKLDLPIKFSEWKNAFPFNMKNLKLWHAILEYYKKPLEVLTEKEIYQYWLSNVYKPE